MLKRLGAVLALAGCSGGALPGAAPNAPAPPAATRSANATLSYAGTLEQTNTAGVTTSYAVTENVTAAPAAGQNVVNYHGQVVQSGKGAQLTTTFDATVAQVHDKVRKSDEVTRFKAALSNSNGVSATTTYAKGNGVFDVLPEVQGAAWTNTAARVVSAANSQAGSTLDDRYQADGSYDERAVPVEGLKATAESYPDGNAVYQWPFGGTYMNSSIAYTPPKFGKMHVVFTDAAQHVTDLITFHSWYPSNPLILASDTASDAGKAGLPKACRVAPAFGKTANAIDESETRVDLVFGEYETTQRTAYVGTAGLLCLQVHDVLETHYDYVALAFSQKPLMTTTSDEVLSLRKSAGASGTTLTSAVAMPLDANVALNADALRLQDAVAIYKSLRRIDRR